MKNLLFISLLFISFNLSAQTKVEDIIQKDSVLLFRYEYVIEGCVKTSSRYVTQDKQNCPVFLDENQFLFYICIIKQHLEYITLDTNVSID